MNLLENIIDLTRLTDEETTELQQSVGTIQRILGRFVIPDPQQRRSLNFMGDKNNTFCRQTVIVSKQHSNVIPSSVNVDATQTALNTYDKFYPLALSLKEVTLSLNVGVMMAGAQVKQSASQMYNYIKCSKRNGELEVAYQLLSKHHKRAKKEKVKTTEKQETSSDTNTQNNAATTTPTTDQPKTNTPAKAAEFNNNPTPKTQENSGNSTTPETPSNPAKTESKPI